MESKVRESQGEETGPGSDGLMGIDSQRCPSPSLCLNFPPSFEAQASRLRFSTSSLSAGDVACAAVGPLRPTY